jgi:hypothetical protein
MSLTSKVTANNFSKRFCSIELVRFFLHKSQKFNAILVQTVYKKTNCVPYRGNFTQGLMNLLLLTHVATTARGSSWQTTHHMQNISAI